jgi:hypothetical protein
MDATFVSTAFTSLNFVHYFVLPDGVGLVAQPRGPRRVQDSDEPFSPARSSPRVHALTQSGPVKLSLTCLDSPGVQ